MWVELSPKEFAKTIDHTILRPDAKRSEIGEACRAAVKYGFAACVVPPYYIKAASKLLKGSDVKPCTVVGFPLGYMSLEAKVDELRRVLEDGAEEVDVVMNISAFKSGERRYVKKEIEELVKVCHQFNALIKVIIETNLLSDDEKIEAAKLVADCGADYVKTNTGFLGRGVTIHDVILIRKAVAGKALVKAAGGIRFFEDALALIKAGASRIGTSTGVNIFLGYLARQRL